MKVYELHNGCGATRVVETESDRDELLALGWKLSSVSDDDGIAEDSDEFDDEAVFGEDLED